MRIYVGFVVRIVLIIPGYQDEHIFSIYLCKYFWKIQPTKIPASSSRVTAKIIEVLFQDIIPMIGNKE